MIFEGMGLSAWITDSGGIPMPEYQVQTSGDYTMECWIPSNEGANFKIQWRAIGDPHPDLDLRGIPWLDGVKLYGEVQKRDRVSIGEVREKSMEVTGSSEARLLEFGKRLLTDENNGVQPDQELLDNLNTIRLRLDWGRRGPSARRTQFRDIQDAVPINERAAKKGHDGSARLGQPINASAPKTCVFISARNVTPVEFVFRYASRDWLKARDIIPYSPPPESQDDKSKLKRIRSYSPEVIDIDDLETDDDEVVIVKHLAPVPNIPIKKRKVKDEKSIEPKHEMQG